MKHSYYKPIPHFIVLRIIVTAPFALIYFSSKFIADTFEKIGNVLDKVLPEAYEYQRLEFHELPQKRQDEIKELNKRIMSQVQRVDTLKTNQ